MPKLNLLDLGLTVVALMVGLAAAKVVSGIYYNAGGKIFYQ